MTDPHLSRIVAPKRLTTDLVRTIVSGGSTDFLKCETITSKGSDVLVPVKSLRPIPSSRPEKTPDPKVEVDVAKWLHGWLRDVISRDHSLMKDDGMWTWISCFPLREYALWRWCNGGGLHGRLLEGTSGLSHFISSSTVHGQARCASRRLYIAAETSWREKGNYSRLEEFFSSADLFSAIFERQIFVRPALAGALVDRYREVQPTLKARGWPDRQIYRWMARCLNVALGSVVLESLEDDEIKSFVDSVTVVNHSN